MIKNNGEYAEEDGMRQAARILAAGAVAMAVASPALAHDGQPLAACAGAVGAWLTTNPGGEPSRTLLSLTADGLVLSADSGEGGASNFAPFTGGSRSRLPSFRTSESAGSTSTRPSTRPRAR